MMLMIADAQANHYIFHFVACVPTPAVLQE